MAEQLSLFDTLYPPATLGPVDPDGAVITGPIDQILRLPHPTLAWDLAAIQLHQHTDGTWMWGVEHAQGGYHVGPKWGRFAATQGEAMHHAAREILDRRDRIGDPGSVCITAPHLRAVRVWAEGLL